MPRAVLKPASVFRMLQRRQVCEPAPAAPKAPHLQSVIHVAGSCTRTGVLPANFTTQYGDLR